jgi:hypothetical protein
VQKRWEMKEHPKIPQHFANDDQDV